MTYGRHQQFSEPTGGSINPTELEGIETPPEAVMQAYAAAGTAMAEKIRDRLHLTSLQYQTMGDLVAAIGLPKEKLCTHCWDGRSD